MPCDDCSPDFTCYAGTSTCRKRPPGENVSLPLADVKALVALAWEMSHHIREMDASATGSIYGIEYAHKTIAKVAVRLPASTSHDELHRRCLAAYPDFNSRTFDEQTRIRDRVLIDEAKYTRG